MNDLEFAPLGKKTSYDGTYNPGLIFPILRKPKRDELQISEVLPFKGYDIWNAYELSWLNLKGKPQSALAEIIFTCDSPCLIESKSMKLYLNSLNNSKYPSKQKVLQIIENDFSAQVKSPVKVLIYFPDDLKTQQVMEFEGGCLDDFDIECHEYQVNPKILKLKSKQHVKEVFYSHLLKSNCLITGQPDWASIQIKYSGMQPDKISILRYLISYRNHNEFHEQCVERIFMDMMRQYKPEELTIYARYTRRGGIDINVIRSTENIAVPQNQRLFRQ